MNTLAAFQHSFARRVWGDETGLEPQHPRSLADSTMQPAFSVYRNTVMKGCIDALQANHPSVSQLVGDAWFRSIAAIYVREHPPTEPRLLRYGTSDGATPGEAFADFLARFEPAASLPYLPGVAQLDATWIACHTAADAAGADPAWLASLDAEVLGGVRLSPHPAARWAWFDSLPIYTIWSGTREGHALSDSLVWRGEGALLTRPVDSVLWSPLTRAGCALLEACAAGATLTEAAAAAQRSDADCDLTALLAQLLQQGAFSQPIAQGTSP